MWTIPNILTVIRLLAAPCVALVFLIFPRPMADFAALILFLGAASTDWLDGYLARRLNQSSKLGAMLDPIADKVMVVIALFVIFGLNQGRIWMTELSIIIMVSMIIILFREVFVSGLREFLGDTAGTLKVTKLAKWKTATQMIAIGVLLSVGIFEHYFYNSTPMPRNYIDFQDHVAFGYSYYGMLLSASIGTVLLAIAALLTLITGIDYLRKAMPYLRG